MQPRAGSLLARFGATPRIAVLRTGRLGDLVVLTPALRALRRALPTAQVTLLVNERALPLASRLRSVDAVIRVPDLRAMERLRDGDPDVETLRTIDALRASRFDVVLQCAGGGETTNAFALALGGAATAGHQWPDSPPLDLWLPYQRNQADVLRHLDLMELIGVPRGPLEYDLDITEADRSEVPNALRGKRLIAVAPGAGSGARCWPPERFAAALDAIRRTHPRLEVALTGTSEEAPLTRSVLTSMQSTDGVHDLAGTLSFGALLALIETAVLFVGNDSAPAHFATALRTPSVVIFGSAHPAQWAAPSRVWHRAVADETAPCRSFQPPCGCPDDASAICISNVDVANVVTQMEALLTLLSASSGSSGSTQGASHARSSTVVGKSW